MYRDSFSLVNYKDRAVIVAGGVYSQEEYGTEVENDYHMRSKSLWVKQVSMFSFEQKHWIDLPHIGLGRARHASCIHEDMLYILGGTHDIFFDSSALSEEDK